MADGATGVIYSIDTNSLMDWQARFYPVDVFASLVTKMDALVASGRMIAAELVREEADPYVIALAQQKSGIVVTQETPAAEKNRPRRTHFIPDVCRELGIPCISLLGMMRREKWVL